MRMNTADAAYRTILEYYLPKHLPSSNPFRIFSPGCGVYSEGAIPAEVYYRHLQRSIKIIGMDKDPEKIARAQAHTPSGTNYSHEFLVGDLNTATLPDAIDALIVRHPYVKGTINWKGVCARAMQNSDANAIILATFYTRAECDLFRKMAGDIFALSPPIHTDAPTSSDSMLLIGRKI